MCMSASCLHWDDPCVVCQCCIDDEYIGDDRDPDFDDDDDDSDYWGDNLDDDDDDDDFWDDDDDDDDEAEIEDGDSIPF